MSHARDFFNYQYVIYLIFLKLAIVIHTVSVQRRHFSSSDNSCCLLSSHSWYHFSLPFLYPENITFFIHVIYIKILKSQTAERELFRNLYSSYRNVHIYFVLAVHSELEISELRNEFETFKDLLLVQMKEDFLNINSKAWVSIKHANLLQKYNNINLRCIALSNDDAVINEIPFNAINCTSSDAALFGEKITDVPALRRGPM